MKILNLISFITLFIFLWGCISFNNNLTESDRFLKNLHKSLTRKKCVFSSKVESKFRNKVMDNLDFINYESDTIYLIKGNYPQDGSLIEAIWTNQGIFEYKIQLGKYKTGSDFFIKKLYQLVEDWDTENIKIYEEKYRIDHGGGAMFGARVIVKEGKMNTECISFSRFYAGHLDQ